MLTKIFSLLTPKERRRAYLLLLMILVMAFLQMLGVASIMPFVGVLSNPEMVQSNPYLAAAYDFLGYEDTRGFMYFLGMVMLAALLFSIAFKALTTYFLLRFTEMRQYSLSKKLIQAYLRQPYEWFLNKHSADLGKSILSEANMVVSGSLMPLMQLIASAAVILALVTLLVVVDPLLALAVAAGLGGSYGAIYFVVRRYLNRIGAERVRTNKERFQAVQEAFGGIKEVKVSGLEAPFFKRFEPPARRFARVQANANILGDLPKFLLQGIGYGGAFIIILYMMSRPGGLQEALPVLAVYLVAGQKLLPEVSKVYKKITKLRFTGPALDSLYQDLMRLKPATGKLSKLKEPAPLGLEHSLRLDNVTYTYPEAGQPALRELTLNIPARTTVGIVGTTGSGKTTTVDVILGLLPPDRGRLLVDNQPIMEAQSPGDYNSLRAWQRSIGYVPQHIYLADETVAANIAFGVPLEEIDMEAVHRAAKTAELHDFVMQELPGGYDTLVGERGVRLSGGQRQRIGIARALYHDPRVLVLDEATSALDNATEKQVMDSIGRMKGERTIILIAHRLSTVEKCDRVYMLAHGELVGQGSYDELLESCQEFKKMAAVNG